MFPIHHPPSFRYFTIVLSRHLHPSAVHVLMKKLKDNFKGNRETIISLFLIVMLTSLYVLSAKNLINPNVPTVGTQSHAVTIEKRPMLKIISRLLSRKLLRRHIQL